LVQNIVASLCIGLEVCLQHIGKEEPFDNDKKDEKFNGDQKPQFLSDFHTPKTLIVEKYDLFYQIHGLKIPLSILYFEHMTEI